jgi:hypothetical protein
VATSDSNPKIAINIRMSGQNLRTPQGGVCRLRFIQVVV